MNNRLPKWFFALFVLAIPSVSQGQTLRQALIHAYRTNPSLTAARAGLRATDEGVPIAKAAARPSLSATADYQEFVVRSANSFSAPLRAASANANLSRSEEHTSELQSLMRISYAVFCLKKKNNIQPTKHNNI